ncbi:MAG TPA: DNA-processing protein DprA [Xenococcaceae cyanobacterium]
MIPEKAYWLAWSQIKGIGATLLSRIHQHFGDLSLAWVAPNSELGKIEGLGYKLLAQVQEQRSQINPEQFFAKHLAANPQFWTPADAEYPRILLEIPSPPPVLYYRGQVNSAENIGISPAPAIAIVGTRYPTKYAKDWTKEISSILTQQGFTIISGMAAGIDTQAHWGCLTAGGRTVAVLGTGVDTVYPSSNRQLYEAIQQQGLVISEYPANTKPERGNFPARNRIIAGLCRAVLIMEAPQKSGALITAHYANDFCRDVYVLPGSLDNQQAIGCLGLLNQGAHVILGAGHLLEMLQIIPQLDTNAEVVTSKENSIATETNNTLTPSSPSQIDTSQLEPELAQIVQVIPKEPISLDAIAQKTNLDTGTLLASLSQLELMGLVSQLPGMLYILVG